jgi:hypothetical protein
VTEPPTIIAPLDRLDELSLADKALHLLSERAAKLEAVVEAWNREWDCSRYPGHPGVNSAVEALFAATHGFEAK